MNTEFKSSSKKITLILLGLVLLIAACQPQNSSQHNGSEKNVQGNITISGAFALYPMVVRWSEEYQKINPDIRIDVSAGGAGKGMADALAGAVDIGMVSRSIKPEEEEQGAYGTAVTKDAVFLTVNAHNPYLDRLMSQGIDTYTLGKIFITNEITTWGQVLGDSEITDRINVFTRSDACGAAEVWVKFLGGSSQEELKGIGISGDPGLLDAVIKDTLGIGYNNLNYAFDATTGLAVAGAAILPIDINSNNHVDADELFQTKEAAVEGVATGTYPEPPVRILYLVTKNKPEGAAAEFIRWILTDGQNFVEDVGYIPLSEEILTIQLEQLK